MSDKKLAGKKLILLGERDGVPGPAMEACLKNSGAEVEFYVTDEGAMDLQNQQRIKDAALKYGGENVVVILGSSEADGAEIYAETVCSGDPTYAGPLAGVQLGLPVYHIFDGVIRKECDPIAWDEQVNMMEMVLDTDKLVATVKGIRDQYSKFKI